MPVQPRFKSNMAAAWYGSIVNLIEHDKHSYVVSDACAKRTCDLTVQFWIDGYLYFEENFKEKIFPAARKVLARSPLQLKVHARSSPNRAWFDGSDWAKKRQKLKPTKRIWIYNYFQIYANVFCQLSPRGTDFADIEI